MSLDPMSDFASECTHFLERQGIDPSLIEFKTPSRRDFGDLASNVAFELAKARHQPPRDIAREIASQFTPGEFTLLIRVEAADNGFINFHADYGAFGLQVISTVFESNDLFGSPEQPKQQAITIEHTSVNPNKPWHIGHARNAILGDTVSRILKKAGYEVEVQNYINDAGRKIAETIYALTYFNAPTGEIDEKYDHFLGEYYVKINAILSQEKSLREQLNQYPDEEDLREIEERLQEIEQIQDRVVDAIRQLEKGEHRATIERVVESQLQTAWHLGIYYDLLTWETDILQARLFEEAMDRIKQSPRVYYPQEGPHKGCLIIKMGEASDNTEEGYTDEVVLIRSNGLPTYTGKDIANQLWKFGLLKRDMNFKLAYQQPDESELWTTHPAGTRTEDRKIPTRVVNVIGVEQQYAQQAVFSALQILGFEKEYAGSQHLDYGLVALEQGKMSGSKGEWVSTDEVIKAVTDEAYQQLRERQEAETPEEDAHQIAQSVAIGAIRFEMCRRDTTKNFKFRIKEILDLQGYSSVYLQYALVRALAILRKAEVHDISPDDWVADDREESERDLLYVLSQFPSIIEKASETLNPSLVTSYGYDLATTFNQFYTKCPVLTAETKVKRMRLSLVKATSIVLKNVLEVLGIPIVEKL